MEIQSNTLDARVLRILLKVYPITVEELVEKVGVSEKKLERVLKGFVSRGFITLEPLGDKTYIRLNRMDFHFLGRKETQKKSLKHVKEKKKKYKRVGDCASDDMMYR